MAKSVVWRCVSRLKTLVYSVIFAVPESQIEQVLVTAINQALCERRIPSHPSEQYRNGVIHENDRTLATSTSGRDTETELLKRPVSNPTTRMSPTRFTMREEKQKVQLDNVGRDEMKNGLPIWATSCGNNHRHYGIRRAACPAAD